MSSKIYTKHEAETAAPDWTFSNEGLERSFSFPDFVAAFSFMTRVAMLSEASDHHPEWSNVYNKVHIRWTTHSKGGVTSKDIEMIEKMKKVILLIAVIFNLHVQAQDLLGELGTDESEEKEFVFATFKTTLS